MPKQRKAVLPKNFCQTLLQLILAVRHKKKEFLTFGFVIAWRCPLCPTRPLCPAFPNRLCVIATTFHQFIDVIAKFFLRVSPKKMFSSVIHLHIQSLCGEPLCTLFHSCTPEAVVVNPRVHRVPWLKSTALYDRQSGFRKKRSTIYPLIDVITECYDNFNSENLSCVIASDIRFI